MNPEFYDSHYYENGPQSEKSLYQNFRWIPELTIPLAHHIAQSMGIMPDETVCDFGCAKGYLVKAFKLLGYPTHGVDVSEYAIGEADKDVAKYLHLVEPCSNDFPYAQHMVCKDVLEHIPYEDIDAQLETLRSKCENIFAIMPLAKNNKYIIPAYELDKSHHIRETGEWWHDRFRNAGFFNINVTTNLGPFKANWQDVNDEGNLLIVGS